MSVTVRVALRVRPFNEKEKKDNLITFIPEENPQQIRINQDRRHFFTFDYVYPPNISQADVYSSCIQPLFDQFIKGYNATILAYGQTGSGKTYSMGTSGFNSQEQQGDNGIVPRFTENLFHWITFEKEKNQAKNQVKCSFLELYHEDIIDLLNPSSTSTSISIREDVFGNISWSGVHDQLVENSADLLNCLQQGSISRTTASTDMNSNSSRSHAIFSVTLIQQLPESIISSKFHFVDLAGSERLKRTNAKGDRAKEGISINSGLLALGNVISALGDEKRNTSLGRPHVPYRNSKLTRLLQDSLGGNSQTLMLACVSPADTNSNETLSTLKYANRAKNITNRVVINEQLSEVDTMKQEIKRLRQEIQVNDAFMKEVHLELDDLRAKNLALSNGLPNLVDKDETVNKVVLVARSQQQQKKQQTKLPSFSVHHNKKKTADTMDDDDDGATLIGSNISDDIKSHRSTSTKRKKRNNNNDKKKSSLPADASSIKDTPSTLFSLDKHINRTRKESLFIKQIKANNDASSDPLLLIKLLNLFQSSIKEQKQLIHHIEQHNIPLTTPSNSSNNKKKSIQQPLPPPPPVLKKNNKPSLIKQPNTITTPSKTEETHRLTLVVEENNNQVMPLKQIFVHAKKALLLLNDNNNNNVQQQLKAILNKITAICNSNKSSTTTTTTTTTRSSEIVVKRKSVATTKRVNIADSHHEIQRIIAFENIKSTAICTEMAKTLKQKKLKLMREQKDLLKERKSMLKEFYHHDYSEQQQKQQYMDERIDVITVEVDFISEQLKLLQPTIASANKIEKSLIDILKPLKEQDLRSLLFMMIQQDLISFNMSSQLYSLTTSTLEAFQQALIQLRRSDDSGKIMLNNSQLISDLLKSPIKCLSNGLILLNLVKAS